MNTIDHMKNLVDLFAKTNDPKGADFYAQVKAYMSEMTSEKNKHSIVECLDFISSVASTYTCHHGEVTSVEHDHRTKIETCKKCGQQRYVWTNIHEEGYGETSTSETKGQWEYPKKKD